MRQGDSDDVEAALRRLGVQHGRALWAYISGFERDVGVVEEVANDVLRIAAAQLPMLRDAPDDRVQGWLFGTARNLLANHARRSVSYRRLVDRLAREPGGLAASVEEEWARHEADSAERDRSERIRATLEAMRDDYRLALVMHARGCSSAEIGDALGVGENAARKRLMRARVAFRETYPALAGSDTGDGGQDG